MKKITLFILFLLFATSFSIHLFAQDKPIDLLNNGMATHIKNIVSFQTDLNGDKKNDYLFHVEDIDSYKLIALVSVADNSYKSYVVINTKSVFVVRVVYAKSLRFVSPESHKRKKIRLDKNYIEIKHPEGLSFIIYWDNNEFKELIIEE